MMFRIYAILLLLTLSLWAQESSSSSHLIGLAILDFEGTALKPDENAALTDRFRTEVLASQTFRIMKRAQMDALLKEQGFQQSGACSSQECLV